MDLDHKRKIVGILRVLAHAGRPMGSITISQRLAKDGIDLRERMIRYYLEMTDKQGLTENLHRRGRIVTDKGRKELDTAVVIDKVGFVNSRIDELAYRMNFNETDMSGTVIMNMSTIETDNSGQIQNLSHLRQEPYGWRHTFDRDKHVCHPHAYTDHAGGGMPPQNTNSKIINLVTEIIAANLGMGSFLQIAQAGQTIEGYPEKVPKNNIVVGTICSVTINGILLRHGIHMTTRFGGLLDLSGGKPFRFSQIINYDGTTIDPLEIFIKGKMTSVIQAARTGNGSIGASFREISIAALPDVTAIIKRLKKIGLGGVLMIGRPNQPLLDIPVSTGCIGLIVAGGLNPIAAIEETGLATISHSLHNLGNFDQLTHIESIGK